MFSFVSGVRMTKLVLCLFLVQFLGANAQVQGSLRLVGSTSSNGGRLEVYINGHWGTVCDDSWSSADAKVACRQLGYGGVVTTLTSSFPSRSSSQRIWLDNVRCTGRESRLIDCSHRGYGIHDCSHSEDVGIYCTTSASQISNGDARLVGWSSQYEGRVEVYYSGQWRTVCYSGWNHEASSVVCKQLGYGLVAGRTSTYTGSSSESVSVYCNGHETSLAECRISSSLYGCYSQTVVRCTNSNVYAPLVWTILIPLVCGLIVLCVLCVPCVVAYCLYRKKKPRTSPVPGNTAEGTVRYTTSDEQPRVGYPTLPSTDREGEVQINYQSGDGGQIGVDTAVVPGLVVMDQPPEDIESPPPSIQQN